MKPGDLVVWIDPGARVIHELAELAGEGAGAVARFVCGDVKPADAVKPYDAKRDHWRPMHPRCEAAKAAARRAP